MTYCRKSFTFDCDWSISCDLQLTTLL